MLKGECRTQSDNFNRKHAEYVGWIELDIYVG